MSVLARYLRRSILGHTLLVMLVLLALTSLYFFITQQDEIGTGSYSTGMRCCTWRSTCRSRPSTCCR